MFVCLFAKFLQIYVGSKDKKKRILMKNIEIANSPSLEAKD